MPQQVPNVQDYQEFRPLLQGLPAGLQRMLACRIARRALEVAVRAGLNPHLIVWRVIMVAEQFVAQQASSQEMAEARILADSAPTGGPGLSSRQAYALREAYLSAMDCGLVAAEQAVEEASRHACHAVAELACLNREGPADPVYRATFQRERGIHLEALRRVRERHVPSTTGRAAPPRVEDRQENPPYPAREKVREARSWTNRTPAPQDQGTYHKSTSRQNRDSYYQSTSLERAACHEALGVPHEWGGLTGGSLFSDD